MGTSASAIKDEFVASMGGGTDGFLTVELTEVAYKTALKESKRWFTSKKGYVIFRPIQIISGQLEYKMKDDVAQVLDVIFQVPTDVSAFFTLGFFDIIPYGPNTLLSMGSGLTNYSGFAQLLDFTEKRKRIFSVDPDWYYEQQTRLLHITARSGTPSGYMLVQAKLTDFDPSALSDKDDYLFVRYMKARMKEFVGRVRSKYDTMPAASGPIAIDGKALIDEAKEEMKELDLEIFASQGVDLPITG